MCARLGLQIHILQGLGMRFDKANNLILADELFGKQKILRCGAPYSDVGEENVILSDLDIGAERIDLILLTTELNTLACPCPAALRNGQWRIIT